MEQFHNVVMAFRSVDEFVSAITRQEGQVGFFLPTTKRFRVGDRIGVTVTVSGVASPVFFEGRVLWRRTQSGDERLPSGSFVELVQRDRARLDGVIAFLRAGGNSERRRRRRYPVAFRAIYKTARGDYSSEVRNLSYGGAFLRCSGPLLTVGAKFPVVLYPQGDGKGLEINARVAWIDYFEDTQGMGIAFVEGQTELRKIRKLVGEVAKQQRLAQRPS